MKDLVIIDKIKYHKVNNTRQNALIRPCVKCKAFGDIVLCNKFNDLVNCSKPSVYFEEAKL